STAKNPVSGGQAPAKSQASVTAQPQKVTPEASNPTRHADIAAAANPHPPNTGELASTVGLTAPRFPLLAEQAAPKPDTRTPTGQVQAQSLSSAPALPLQRFFDLGKFKQQQTAQ